MSSAVLSPAWKYIAVWIWRKGGKLWIYPTDALTPGVASLSWCPGCRACPRCSCRRPWPRSCSPTWPGWAGPRTGGTSRTFGDLSHQMSALTIMTRGTMLLTSSDPSDGNVGGDGGVVGWGKVLDSEPEMILELWISKVVYCFDSCTYRKSLASPFFALMPCVAVNLWPGILIIGTSSSSCGEGECHYKSCYPGATPCATLT